MTNNYPLVLAHGIARFDAITQSMARRWKMTLWDMSRVFDRLHYFKGMQSFLRGQGFETYATTVGFADDVDARAGQLAAQVKTILAQSGHHKVHLIGHSMGGLDGRHAIVDKGLADRVASLTTIGTPHLGTSLAEVGLGLGGVQTIEALRPYLDLGGFRNLPRDVRRAFNERARHAEATNDVVYQVYASAQAPPRLFRPLHLAWQIIHNLEGENDGLVPVASQLWQSELVNSGGRVKPIHQHHFPFPADHLNQTGWWDLEELAGLRFWLREARRQKRDFEASVKEIYLQIARDAHAL